MIQKIIPMIKMQIGRVPFTSKVHELAGGGFEARTDFNGKVVVGHGTNARQATISLGKQIDTLVMNNDIPSSRLRK